LLDLHVQRRDSVSEVFGYVFIRGTDQKFCGATMIGSCVPMPVFTS
jgi:hypothetical protein